MTMKYKTCLYVGQDYGECNPIMAPSTLKSVTWPTMWLHLSWEMKSTPRPWLTSGARTSKPMSRTFSRVRIGAWS